MPTRIIFGLVVTLLALTSFAQNKDTARSHVEAALTLYKNLEYERALEELYSAQRRARTEEETVSVLLYEGIILAEMGREEESVASFEAVLRLQPDAQLPVKVSPKIAQRFETLRQHQNASPPPAHAALEPDKTSPPIEPKPQIAPSPVQANPLQETKTTSATLSPEITDRGALRFRAIIPAIGGGALLVSGGVFYALARNEHSRLQKSDPSLTSLEDVRRSGSRGQTYQVLGFSLMGVGLAGLSAAAGLYVLGDTNAPVSLGVGTTGTSAFVQGRWP